MATNLGGISVTLSLVVQDFLDNVSQAISSLNDLKGSFTRLGGEMSAAITLPLEQLAAAVVDATGHMQVFMVSMTALTGSAQAAGAELNAIRQIASDSPFALNDLLVGAQRLEAFGIELDQINQTLIAVQNSAAATGRSFDAVSTAFNRVALTGVVTQRALQSLGVSWAQLAETMGTSAEAAKAALSKGVIDASTALQILDTTVNNTFNGIAEKMADSTIPGQLQKLKNQIEISFEGLGDAIAPYIQQVLDLLKQIPDFIDQVTQAFNNLSPAQRDFVVGALAVAAAIGPILLAVAGLAAGLTAITALSGSLEIVAAGFGAIALTVAAIKFTGLMDSFETIVRDAPAAIDHLQSISEVWGLTVENGNRWLDELQSKLKPFQSVVENVLGVLIPGFTLFKEMVIQSGDALTHLSDFLRSFFGAIAPAMGALAGVFASVAAAIGKLAEGQKQLQQSRNGESGFAGSEDTGVDSDFAAAALKQKVAAEIAAASAAKDIASIAKWNDKWAESADEVINMLDGVDEGTFTATAVLSKLTNVLEQGSVGFDKLNNSGKLVLDMLVDGLAQLKQKMQDAGQAGFAEGIVKEFEKVQKQADITENRVPANFEAMMRGISQGLNFQPLFTTLETDAVKMQDLLSQITNPTTKDAKTAGLDQLLEVKQRLSDMLGALKLIGEDRSMQTLASNIQGFVNVLDTGKMNESQFQSGLDSISDTLLKKVIPAMERGVAITPELLSALQRIPAIGPALAAAATAGIDPFTQALTKMAEASRLAALSVDNAFKDLGVTSLDAATNSLTRFGDDIIAIFKNINNAGDLTKGQFLADEQALITWATKVIPIMQATGEAIKQNVLDQIAKLSPAFAQAAANGPGALKIALDALTTTFKTQTMTIVDAYQQFGIQSASALQNTIDLETRAYALLVQQGAPLQTIITAYEKITQNSIAYEVATGGSATAVLQLTQNLVGAQFAQFALTTQTRGLADAFIGIAKGFQTAWGGVEKGLADAIVSGQDFGKVMTKVWVDLKKAIVEVAVKYLGDQLLASIVSATGGFGLLNAVMGSTTTIAASTSAAVATSMTTAAASMAASASSIAASMSGAAGATAAASGTISSSMATATAAVNTAAASMVADFTLIGVAIGAIAGIIGDIQQAHANKLLGEIEVSTREANARLAEIQKNSELIAASLQTMVDFNNNYWSTYFGELLGTLSDILTTLQAGITVSGTGDGSGSGTLGGGGGTGKTPVDTGASQVLKDSLNAMITTLSTSVASALGTSTDPVAATVKNLVGNLQTELDKLTSSKTITSASLAAFYNYFQVIQSQITDAITHSTLSGTIQNAIQLPLTKAGQLLQSALSNFGIAATIVDQSSQQVANVLSGSGTGSVSGALNNTTLSAINAGVGLTALNSTLNGMSVGDLQTQLTATSAALEKAKAAQSALQNQVAAAADGAGVSSQAYADLKDKLAAAAQITVGLQSTYDDLTQQIAKLQGATTTTSTSVGQLSTSISSAGSTIANVASTVVGAVNALGNIQAPKIDFSEALKAEADAFAAQQKTLVAAYAILNNTASTAAQALSAASSAGLGSTKITLPTIDTGTTPTITGTPGSAGAVPGSNPNDYVSAHPELYSAPNFNQQPSTNYTATTDLSTQTQTSSSLALSVTVNNADATDTANTMIKTWRAAGVPI